MIIFSGDKKFIEYKYTNENEFEKEIVLHSKQFFGKNTIYIDAKKKIDSKALGGVIPDGFLFDLSDKNNPEFYLVEVELSRHSFFNHIFPQITKFFAFFRNKKSQGELIEKLFSVISSDTQLKQEFRKFLGDKEIYKFVKDVLDESQNILLIIDAEKNELPEIVETYTDTWGKLVKILILKKFTKDNDFIFSMTPDFQDIEYAFIEPSEKAEEDEDIQYSEEYHLESVRPEIKNIYSEIKNKLLKINPEIKFNPQKYYISIRYKKNIAFFKIGKSKIRLVVILQEDTVRKKIKHTLVKPLSESVQKFYNGTCCELIIDTDKDLDEIINLIKDLIDKMNQQQSDALAP